MASLEEYRDRREEHLFKDKMRIVDNHSLGIIPVEFWRFLTIQFQAIAFSVKKFDFVEA